MWLFQALSDGFSFATREGRIQGFRMMLGLACTVKFALALLNGGPRRLDAPTFSRYKLQRQYGRRIADSVARLHRPLLFARLPAALLFTAGVRPKAAALIVLLGLLHELLHDFRFNTCYLALLTTALLTAGDLGSGFSLSTAQSTRNTWAQWLVVVLTTDMYWNSAWLKLRSPQFMSGTLLAQYFYANKVLRTRLPYREYALPSGAYALLGTLEAPAVRRCRVLAVGTVVLEIALPLALLSRAPLGPVMVTGAVLHAAFALLSPRAVIGFSLATVSTYPLFVP
ncbi:hypothetical protein FM076_31290 [Streptomyces albus subsp. chlorinus]|uniref:hypothetical protein n=1 Tax=Streptomyces albus TaxID=1888 RepID=UPI00156D652A|nr:hypothetical protein [Streptomyces albus]NSC25396.1 hypothetical protein [Streptomyces albus subsp. chlorinus]